jgi:anti-sigma regulatory factor (Ser/Thr protein kinase)
VKRDQRIWRSNVGGTVAAVLASEPQSAAHARALVTTFCSERGFEALCDDLCLVATELVANAIRHAGTDMTIRLEAIDGGVRLEVEDGSTRPLRPRPAAPSDEGGRGLLLVDALSSRYGVEGEAHGKRVWAELLLDAV